MTNYDLLVPAKIRFGCGKRAELAAEVGAIARRAFVVSGSRTLERTGEFGRLLDAFTLTGLSFKHVATLSHEPEVADVDELVRELEKHNASTSDCVVAIGGGSAIDLAKAAAALVTNRTGSSVVDYLEGVGRGCKIVNPPLPLIALPTTAGTGTEATKNAVISSYSPAFKKSLRSELMVPKVVIVDPELSVGLSASLTAFTGMDAITQLIESYISKRRQPIPQALGLQGTALAIPQLITAVANGNSLVARSAMAHAALLSGIALANSGLGFAHGVAAALGVHARVPHGLACALLLPTALRLNREVAAAELAQLGAVVWDALQGVDDTHPLRNLISAHRPTGADAAELLIAVIDEICNRIEIPQRLSNVGVTESQIRDLVPASRGNSMDGNPRPIDDAELEQVLRTIL